MEDQNRQELLHMHQFYTQEARHQRTMMWDTVKWFTPILTLIGGVWYKYYIEEFLQCNNIYIRLSLFAISIFGLSLCFCCILLLRTFYKTNLKYISMFAKVEGELNFDKRMTSSDYYPGDDHITWEGYRDSRKGNESKFDKKDDSEIEKFTSKKHIKKQLQDQYLLFKNASIFSLMKAVFYLFGLFFLGCILLLILNY